MKTGLSIRLAAALLLVALLPQGSLAQQGAAHKHSVDLGAFAKEIMALRIEGGQHHLAMWTPYEFFVAAAISDGNVSKESMEKHLGFLKSYVPIFVSASVEKPDGTDVYATEAEVRRRATLVLSDGSEVRALDANAVPPNLSAIVSQMKTFMAAQGGADRENMHILVFPATTPKGKTVINTAQKDKLTLMLKADARFRETAFTWRTPFDAMSSVPDCPRCKAGVSAKWTYCPYCGQKLPQ